MIEDGQPPAGPRGSSIVGRDRELATLHECFARTVRGHGSLVLVSGEAGIGKTTLVRALVAQTGQEDVLVMTGSCVDLVSTPPYGPWIEMIATYPGGNTLPPVPEVFQRGTGMGDISNQIELFSASYDFMAAIASACPVILILEDMHWSDPASLGMLRFLVRRAQEHRLLIVVTYRNDEISSENPLFQLLPLLSRESNAQRIDLRPIEETDLATLLSRQFELPETDLVRLTSYLTSHAEGNPLFFWEIIRELQNEGTLRDSSGHWRVGDLDRLRIPSMLHQVIERRLDRVVPEHRGLLEVAAIIGPEVDIDLWQEVSGADDDMLDKVITSALDTNLMNEGSSGMFVAFSHALVRESLYQRASPLRRRRVHGQIAAALIGRSDPDENTVAHHLELAADKRAADWLIGAGERAERTYAVHTAAERFARAAELLRDNQARSNERGWLLYRAARHLRFTQRERGIELLNEAERIGRMQSDHVLTAFAVADRGHIQYLGDHPRGALNDLTEGVRLIDELPADYIQSSDIRNWISDIVSPVPEKEMQDQGFLQDLGHFNPRRASLALILAGAGMLKETLETGEPLRQQLGAIHNPDHHILSPYADVSNALAMAYSQLGDAEKSRAAYTAAFESMRRINHVAFIGVTVYGLLDFVVLPFETERLDERKRLEALVREAARDAHRWMLTESPDPIVNLKLLYLEGRWQEALDRSQRKANTPLSGLENNLKLYLGLIARAMGDQKTAHACLVDAMPSGSQTDVLEIDFQSAVDACLLGGSLALDEADIDTAHTWLRKLDQWLDWSGAVRGRAQQALIWSRYYHHLSDTDRAWQQAESALAHATSPRQPLPLIQANRLLGRLSLERGEYPDADDYLKESLTLAENCAAPFETAQTKIIVAEWHLATNQPDAARQMLEEARETCTELGARPTLEQIETLTRRLTSEREQTLPLGLTRRELDVLRLVARGYSDPAIADALFIARRTVNTHLTSIFRKLDVSNRTAAALFAREHDLSD